ncbi:MAG: indolepyruvate ferredoxin oxidoreductase family protein [bacterium]
MAVPANKLDLSYTLDDKYVRDTGRIYLNGIQALVRLPLMQRQLDRANGLNTGGFISGYRGSPLGGLDLNLWRARQHLSENHISFVPGVNEDLAATAVWGSQQVNLWPGAKYDGVFSMWYGKGPGVDRCGDVFKHANAAGTSKHGGVLVLAGDDHACRSSTLPHQSEHEFLSAIMPILNPTGVQDILELGLYGWAMSRYTGRWVGFKTIAETVESSASVNANPHDVKIIMPEDFELPVDGLNIRWPDDPMSQEMRLHRYALFAAQAFCRANKLDKMVIDSPKARLGIITTGKSYLDVLQALEYLGIDDKMAADIGIRVYKVAMTWPLEPQGIQTFAKGLDDIIVVEEKRSFMERQLKEQLYNWDQKVRPSVIGKYDEQRNWVLPSVSELTPAMIARVIAKRLDKFFTSEQIRQRLAFLDQKEADLEHPNTNFSRTPHFCSGCPHNTSTKVPEGSRAMAGIGCHYMTVWMDRRTETFTQMGGEGTPWIGQAPFTDTKHVFVNLGDGTYYHSGLLAIRACVAGGVNITFKILYNDAVAMTGGQPVDGPLSVADIARQVRDEGVDKMVLVSDDPEKWYGKSLPSGMTVHHRDELDDIQHQFREIEGVSLIIYEQTCAAEKRRRRKRGKMIDPPKRVIINPEVCEGCGDCSIQSNCLSIVPLETELGRKRSIDQSSCNKDFSCINGFCPSFVTVHGGELIKGENRMPNDIQNLPEPEMKTLDEPYNMLITGVGGTGVVTIGALIGMAAHLEGKGVNVLDQTGLAQKGGAVTSHVRIAETPEQLHAVRIAAGESDLVLGCDMVVAAAPEPLAKMRENRTFALINDQETMPGLFSREPDLQFPTHDIKQNIIDAVGEQHTEFVPASRLATAILGDSISTNLFMMGYAWQKGFIPISADALMRAIELNGVAIEANNQAFVLGRLAAHDIRKVESLAGPTKTETIKHTLDGLIADRKDRLQAYQNNELAKRYEDFVRKVQQAENKTRAGSVALSTEVARNYFKLLAIKDEYEVARLHTNGALEKVLDSTFKGDYQLHFHMAPPLFSKKDPQSGRPIKKEFGAWMKPAMKVLASLRFLRGTAFDIFSYQDERKVEKALITQYEQGINQLLAHLSDDNLGEATAIAALPMLKVRGFGPVKMENIKLFNQQWERRLKLITNSKPVNKAA